MSSNKNTCKEQRCFDAFFSPHWYYYEHIPSIEAGIVGLAVVSVSTAPAVVAAPSAAGPGIAPVSVRVAVPVRGVGLLFVPQMWRYIAVARAATLQVQTSKLEQGSFFFFLN